VTFLKPSSTQASGCPNTFAVTVIARMIWTQHQNTLGANSAPSTGSTLLYLGNFMVSVPLSRTPRLLPASLQACETWSSEDTSNNLNFCSIISLFPPSQIYWPQFSSHNPNDILPIQHRALLSKQCYYHFYYSLPTPLRLSHDSTHAFFTSTDSIRSFLDRMYGIKGSSHSSPPFTLTCPSQVCTLPHLL